MADPTFLSKAKDFTKKYITTKATGIGLAIGGAFGWLASRTEWVTSNTDLIGQDATTYGGAALAGGLAAVTKQKYDELPKDEAAALAAGGTAKDWTQEGVRTGTGLTAAVLLAAAVVGGGVDKVANSSAKVDGALKGLSTGSVSNKVDLAKHYKDPRWTPGKDDAGRLILYIDGVEVKYGLAKKDAKGNLTTAGLSSSDLEAATRIFRSHYLVERELNGGTLTHGDYHATARRTFEPQGDLIDLDKVLAVGKELDNSPLYRRESETLKKRGFQGWDMIDTNEPMLDKDGKPVMKDGKPVMKKALGMKWNSETLNNYRNNKSQRRSAWR